MNKLVLAIILILIFTSCTTENNTISQPQTDVIESSTVEIERIIVNSDKNENGIFDADDIIEGARLDVQNKSKYKDAYYSGGYPPDDEGVCTDVIWRAYKHAGYNLKDMMDADIKVNVSKYPRVNGAPEPNIDFRRVPNYITFFSRFGDVLTNEIDPDNLENLKEWQGGDIVIIKNPEHIGIISDKRNKKGVPYVIHNMGPIPREDDCLESWSNKITGHFRYPK